MLLYDLQTKIFWQLRLGPIRMSSADPEAVVTDPTITTVETVVTTQEMDAEQEVWITNQL